MIRSPWSTVLGHVHRLFQGGGVAGLSEGQLLDRFVEGRDEVAFGAIVARHGPMVLGVCRGVLHDPSDVEDAFQATFLVLVRRAAGLRDRDRLGPWLYGVARKVALRARADASRRRARERSGAESRAEAVPTFDDELRELQARVREEVDKLPPNDRMAVVLCYLEGLTHEEAAERLGWPVGTVKGRLSRARERLRARLGRRGIVLPAAVATLAKGASAAVPPRLIASTVLAAAQLAAGDTLKAGIVSAHALALMGGVIRTMFLTKLKIGAAALATAGALTVPGVMEYQSGGPSDGGPKNAPGVFPPPQINPGAVSPTAEGPNSSPRVVNPPVQGVPVVASSRMEAASLADIQAARAQAAAEAVDVMDQLIAQGKASPTDPSFLTWSRRVAEAKSASGLPEAERRAALRDHLTRMTTYRERVKELEKQGKVSRLEVLEAAYRYSEAYLWNLEGTATSQPSPASTGGGGFDGGASAPRKPLVIRTMPGDEKRNQAILAKLEERISMNFPNETPLEDIKKYIEQSTQDEAVGLPLGIPIYIDPEGLNDADKTMASTVKINLEGIPLRTTLRLMLRQLHLDYKVEGGLLYITDEENLDRDFPAEPRGEEAMIRGGQGGGFR